MHKQFRNLKQRQKEQISAWLFEEYHRVWLDLGHEPPPRYNTQIPLAVEEKIKAAEIWIPIEEVELYFYRRKSHYSRRINKQLQVDTENGGADLKQLRLRQDCAAERIG